MNIQSLDKAFVNSILSYGIYTEREWFFTNNYPPKPTKDLRSQYDHILSEYVESTFKPVELNHLNGRSKSNVYEYHFNHTYEKGLYTSLDNLSKAGVFISKNEKGENILHVTFRGTDINAKSFIKFATKAYLDMSAYYDSFKPLEKAIIEYASNPDNKITSIQVSGHSLGGAMVQEFVKSEDIKKMLADKQDLNIEAFTYGAPGSNKIYPYSIATSMYHAIKNKNFLFLGSTLLEVCKDIIFGGQQILTKTNENMKNLEDEKVIGRVQEKNAFLKLGSDLFRGLLEPFKNVADNLLSDAPQEKLKKINLYQFRDEGDPVPMAGNFVYRKTGIIKTLFDYVSNDTLMSKIIGKEQTTQDENTRYFERNDFHNIKFKKAIYLKENLWDKISKRIERLRSAKYHDMLRYSMNLEMSCKTLLLEEYKEIKKTQEALKSCHYLNAFHEVKQEYFLQNNQIKFYTIEPIAVAQVQENIKKIRSANEQQIPNHAVQLKIN